MGASEPKSKKLSLPQPTQVIDASILGFQARAARTPEARRRIERRAFFRVLSQIVGMRVADPDARPRYLGWRDPKSWFYPADRC